MGRNFKKICEQLNIDYKKNLSALLLKIVIILIGSVVISIFVNLLMGIICAFFIFPIYLMHINNLEKKYDQLLNAKEISFYSLYRFLLNMLDNQIILYNALKECIDLIDDILKKDVSKLIEDIENDSSINPFFHFRSEERV